MRGNQLPAALKESHVSVNKYINPKNNKIMLIKLIRNQPQGKALFGQLYVDGKSFCDTLENTDYAIPTGFY